MADVAPDQNTQTQAPAQQLSGVAHAVHTNVSAQDFQKLNEKVDKLTSFLQGQASSNQTQQQAPAQAQTQQQPVQQSAPAQPATVAGMNEEQVKALVAQNEQFKQQQRTSTLNNLATKKGVKLDDNLTKLILSNSKTDDDLEANIDSLAKVETVQKSNPTTGGFKPDNSSGETTTDFQAILNNHFGKKNNQ